MANVDPWAAFPLAEAPTPAQPTQGAAADPWAAFALAGDAAPAAPSSGPSGSPQDRGALASGLGGFLDGVPVAGPYLLGGAEKAGAALRTLRDGGTYADSLARAQATMDATSAAHPWAHTAGAVAGGIVGTAPAVAAAPEWFGAGTGGLAGRMLAGAGTGAGIGAADGAVRSDGSASHRAAQVAISAGLGASGGGIAPAIGAAAGAAGRALLGSTVRDTAEVPASVRAEVMRAWHQDAPLDPQGALDRLGPHGMLADAGPSLQGIAMGQAAKDGAGAPVVLDALKARDAGASGRILSDVGAAVGPAQNADAVGRQIADVGQASTAPLFARAEAAGVPWSAAGEALTQRPAVASAMRGAAQDAANAGHPLPTITLDAAGQPVGSDAALQAYEAGQRPALTEALARLTGSDPNMGPLAATDALAARRSAEADPLYGAYRSMQVPMTPELADVLGRPSVQAALPAAERKAADQGRSIYAAGPGDRAGAAPGAGHELPDPVAGLGPAHDVPATPWGPQALSSGAPPRPTGPAPVSLLSFLQRAGVQDPGGDLRSMGFDRFPGLIREGGVPLDRAREAAAEAGYLGGDTARAVRETGVNDLLDALGSHPTYSVHDGDAVAARQAWADHQASRGAPTPHDHATEAVRSHLLDAGVPANTIDPTTLDVAAHLHGRGMEPGAAWESAVMAPPFPGDAPAVPRGAVPGQAAQRPLTPEGIDYVKRALGDRIDTAQRAGERDDARVFTGLQRDLLGAVERHPDPSIADAYGAARRAYAGPSREMDALAAGREAIADGVTPEAVQRQYGALGTDGERQRFRDGVFTALRDRLGKASDTANFVRTVAGSQALRDKFAAIAPHPEALDAFNAAVGRAQAQFTEAQRPTPAAWRATLDQLDGMAAKGDAGAGAARDAVAAHLGQNPDFARARALQADYGNPAVPGSGALPQALQAGRTGLMGGPNAVHPADYAAAFDARSPAAQAAQRAGLNSEIYRQLGDKPNDLVALKNVVKGENDRSLAVLGRTFGEPAADLLANTADRESTFAQTSGDVLHNSITARRGEMIAAQKAAAPDPFQLRERHDLTMGGATYTAAVKSVNALLRALQPAADTSAHDAALSRVVTATGAERQRMLAELLEAHRTEIDNAALADALDRPTTMLSAAGVPAMANVLLERRR